LKLLSYNSNFWFEANQQFHWYEGRAFGLGRRFLNEVKISLDRITAFPDQYALVTATIHQCPVERFPFTIVYRIKSDRIRILAVWHNARHSGAWKFRK